MNTFFIRLVENGSSPTVMSLPIPNGSGPG